MTRALDTVRIGCRGEVTIRRVAPDGRTLEVVTIPNRLKDGYLDILAAALRGDDAGCRYVALGTDDTPNDAGNDAAATLGAEVARFSIDSQHGDLGLGITFTRRYLSQADADGVNIREIGWFFGPDATAAADSGVLGARILYTHNKGANGPESLYIDRTDTIVRGA